MVVVVRDVAGVAVLDMTRRVRVGVPDRRALAVLVPCAFDLVRRGADAPVEAFRERAPLKACPQVPASVAADSRANQRSSIQRRPRWTLTPPLSRTCGERRA